MIAAEIANLPHGGDRKSESFKLTKLSLNQEKAAKQLGTTEKAITQGARQVNLRPASGRSWQENARQCNTRAYSLAWSFSIWPPAPGSW